MLARSIQGVMEMQRIRIRLRLDTPLLLGGSEAGTLESTNVIRPPSLRGLFRTFTRAYLGYLVGSADDKATLIRKFESALLGSAASDDGCNGNTYRVGYIGPLLTRSELNKYDNVPKPQDPALDATARVQHGSATGFIDGEETFTIELSIPRRSLGSDGRFLDAFEGMCWLALTLGSLGKRSRRGYGSISISSMQRFDLASNVTASELPIFEDVNSPDAFARLLQQGLTAVKRRFLTWLGTNATSWCPGYEYKEDFFQFPGDKGIHISESVANWRTLMEQFNLACHELSSVPVLDVERNPVIKDGKQVRRTVTEYRDYIGKGSRLASPVWMRIHQVGAGYVALITVSEPKNIKAQQIAAALVNSVTVNGNRPKSIAGWCS
jgi:CRISPR/Cas system CMR-associated protein Cmr1 (group 7 of RAMP superfamily)